MSDGFIKLYRSLLKWEWYKSPNTKIVFLHLLLKANWEDSSFRGYKVPRGSLIVGRKKLSEELGISERSVRVALNHLQMTNEVTIKTTNQFSIVTIVNWEKYQGYSEEVTNKMTNEMSDKRPTSDHIKEIKNIRKEEYKKEKPKNPFLQGTQQTYDWDEINRELGIK